MTAGIRGHYVSVPAGVAVAIGYCQHGGTGFGIIWHLVLLIYSTCLQGRNWRRDRERRREGDVEIWTDMHAKQYSDNQDV